MADQKLTGHPSPTDSAMPGAKAIVHVVRHGEVNNPEGILYGRLPGYHLSDLGHQMAERVGQYLAPLPITHLACSPLERARETMAAIASHHSDLPVSIDQGLIEADSFFAGQVFGGTNKALKNPKNWLHCLNPFKPSWGEPYLEIAVRMRVAIQQAANAAVSGLEPGEVGQAVLVSHQLPIWIARLSFNNRRLWHDPRSRQCTLASVTSFHFDSGNYSGFEYAEPAIDLVPPKARKAVFSAGKNPTSN